MRHRNQSLTLEQNKAEVYKEIKDSRLDSFREPNIIEYMTEYCERSDLPRQHSEAGLTTGHHKQIKSINVLREKLKSKCGQS